MSTTIDQKVVEMRFDNRHFENNVKTTMSTLDRLKQSLNLSGASKGLENIDSAAKKVNMQGLGSAVEAVSAKFSALQVMGVTALANITNSAVNAGKRMVSALTIDPIKTGFQEYETQINAVQTILANTSNKGTNLKDVNKALDQLNTYADKTIYNFTEMTRNIGTFTAAGVDLDTSVSSIQGIANLAAVSGSTSQQASTAMYQLSQALAAGKVSLMDWNSVVNAGMGGQVFQDALKRTATVMGKDVDGLIKKYGSFRESLTQGEWLTTDVLTKTLEQFTMAAEEGGEEWNKFKKSLMEEGYTEAQAEEILKMANTATDAATKVKTFTQLWDTLKEAAQSGWTQTWEIIVGDFEEAKSLLTNVSNVLGEMIGKSAKARNELLQGWKDAGGRNDLIEGLSNVFEGLLNIVAPIKEAFRDVFPPMTVDTLLKFTEGFKNLTSRFKEFGTKYADQIKRIFTGIFSIVDIGKKIFTAFANSVSELVGSSGVAKVGDFLINAAASIGDFFTSINDNFDANGVGDIFNSLASGISDALGKSVDIFKGFGSALSTVGDFVVKAANSIWEGLKTVFGWISENFSAGDIFAGLAGGGIFVLAKKLTGFIDGIKESIEGLFSGKTDDIKSKFTDLLDGVSESLQSFSTGIKVGSFVAIAASIAILASAFEKIAVLDAEDIAKSLITMGIALGFMTKAINGMPTNTRISSGLSTFTENTNLIKSGVALVLMAESLKILSDAIIKLSDLSWEELVKGLGGVGVGLGILCGGLKLLNGTKVSLSTSIAMLALAEACKILGDAMTKFVGFSWDEIGRGLAGMGGAVGEMVIALSVLSKVGGFGAMLGGTGILIAVQSLSDLADGLAKFGSMSWDEIGRGLAGMGGALGEVAGITGALGKIAGFSSLFAAGSILIVVQGLGDLATNFKEFGSMSWDEIGRGLAGMGGALGEVALITGALGKLSGFSSLFASGSILIVIQGLGELADSFGKFGSMSWDEIGKGLAGMGGALLEVSAITGALGVLAGFSSLFAAGAIFIVIQGLGDLADSFNKFGSMSWDEIGRGLVGMGGALGEVAIISGALGSLAGLPALLGGGAILLAVQGLGDLADALKKFGEMSWGEIGRGLTAMGAAMGELALGSVLNTLSGLGAGAISELSSSLGVLADSVKKWTNVTVPEDLSTNLGKLADGVIAFTFGGMGASAISEAATGVGTMAESVKKWIDVVVPENLGSNLTMLADGVKAFTFGGLGASALAEASPGVASMADSVTKWIDVVVPENLGSNLSMLASGVKAFTFGGLGASALAEASPGVASMADSVSKWTGVMVPENLGTNLSALATGVKAFTFGGLGAGAMNEAAPGVGAMADSVKKWTGVVVPENLGTNLGTLASGVKKFTFGGSGAESIATCASSLGVMANSVKKWIDIEVPENIGTNLGTLASGVKKFTFGGSGAENIATAATGLGSMATAVKKWSDVIIPEGLAGNLSDLAGAVNKFSGVGDITETVGTIGSLASKVSELAGVSFESINTGLSNFATAITGFGTASSSVSGVGDTISKELVEPLKNVSSKVKNVGSDVIKTISNGIKNNKGSLTSAATSIVTQITNAIKNKSNTFTTAGGALISKLASGILKNTKKVSSAMTNIVRNAASGIKTNYVSMVTAGIYLGDGLVAGIKSKKTAAYNAGYALGQAAVQGEKAGQQSNSPSKATIKAGKWIGEGLVIGIERMGRSVYNAGHLMGTSAVDSISNSISRISDVINSDIDTQPTIRPVLDLSDVRSGAGTINGLFGNGIALATSANAMMVGATMGNHQNGGNAEVISAINDLKDTLSRTSGDTYSINGITYDDGSNITDAVKSLVRAAKIERRV